VVLIERHTVTIPGGHNPRVARVMTEKVARSYADAHGFEIAGLGAIRRADGTDGVTFDVVVGKGDANDDTWTWGGRMNYWADRLRIVANTSRRRIVPRPNDGSAEVIPMRTWGYPGSGQAVEGEPCPNVTNGRGRVLPHDHAEDGGCLPAPSRHGGVWRGPDAIKGGGIGIAGTGELPPWMARMFAADDPMPDTE
jgi:hypothetical protein